MYSMFVCDALALEGLVGERQGFAATLIQAVWRGYAVRTGRRSTRQLVRCRHHNNTELRSATAFASTSFATPPIVASTSGPSASKSGRAVSAALGAREETDPQKNQTSHQQQMCSGSVNNDGTPSNNNNNNNN
eukprot:PhM_4_TR14177/c4_g1_i1/m.47475